ncbi:MAG: NAD-dependent epimerase/dehydratase family protein [Bauldia sp.]
MRLLVTGSAGFIGFHLARRLLADGHTVVGYDGMTPYYDVELKRARHAILARSAGFTAVNAMLEDADALRRAADLAAPEIIVHLAAQAGVRYSMENPRAYIDANLVGSWNLLDAAQNTGVRHLVLASTSSVYGANAKAPFAETDRADEPLSLYAATKKAMEAMAHAHSHLHALPTTVLRFFTVYGPWGRPDMALFKFVDAILNDRPIEVYGEGRMSRDFTYVDDLVEAIVRLTGVVPGEGNRVAGIDSLSAQAPFRVVNIAGGQPTALLDLIAAVEAALGRTARRTLLPMQPGDVPRTDASPALLEALTGFRPGTPVNVGVEAFVAWYRDYYRRPA